MEIQNKTSLVNLRIVFIKKRMSESLNYTFKTKYISFPNWHVIPLTVSTHSRTSQGEEQYKVELL